MAEWATGRVRRTSPRLEQALTGLVRDHPRRMLAIQLAPLACLDEPIEVLRAERSRCLTELRVSDAPPPGRNTTGEGRSVADPGSADTPLTFIRALRLLDTLLGVDPRGAERGVTGTGIDMGRFGTASRRAAGAGVAPGNAARAGKQRSGRTRPGHQPLRTVLPQLAHAAARTPGTSLTALYPRRAARRGKQRAMVAVAHSMGVSALHRLSRQAPSQDVGAHSFDAPRRHHLVDRLTRRMEHVGDRVQ